MKNLMLEANLASHGPVNPTFLVGNIGVDTGDILLATANTPGHDANLGQNNVIAVVLMVSLTCV